MRLTHTTTVLLRLYGTCIRARLISTTRAASISSGQNWKAVALDTCYALTDSKELGRLGLFVAHSEYVVRGRGLRARCAVHS